MLVPIDLKDDAIPDAELLALVIAVLILDDISEALEDIPDTNLLIIWVPADKNSPAFVFAVDTAWVIAFWILVLTSDALLDIPLTILVIVSLPADKNSPNLDFIALEKECDKWMQEKGDKVAD